ncbi:MAG: hypothetical protein WA159_24970 [Variovorax sp.]
MKLLMRLSRLRREARAIAAALLGTLCVCTSHAQSPDRFANAGTSEAAAHHFLESLQEAVARDDRQAVAALFSCPCTVWDGRRSVKLKRASDVPSHYDALFTPELKKMIAAARPADLFSNWQGVMLGDGRMWLSPAPATGQLFLTTINAPAPTSPAARP